MCQLLGMNCAKPTDFSFSFRGFCQRGGKTDIHSHGFGIAIYEGPGLRCFLDTKPASESPIAQMVQQYPIRTYNMLAHVRYATTGAVNLQNVHPFSRELWGIQWSFAHNGQVPKYDDSTPQEEQPFLGKSSPSCVHYHPVGDTDSEAVFCAILNALKDEFDTLPTLPVLHRFLSRICNEIIQGDEESTIFNFLLGCGPYTLFAYSWPGRRPGSAVWNGLYYIIREAPFSTAQLVDTDYSIDFAKVTTESDRVAVITTKPLTNETGWTEFERGQLLMFDKGLPYKTPKCCESVEKAGRGLSSKCFERRRRSVSIGLQLHVINDDECKEEQH
eukprot:CAMPEP_0119547938 /NCGR_PEP_ID=MMETSP1352-20130426/1952_1 /TAXON_ID=265584 /ORGANISM="Stauroneis constricta, Strain CCMP1120" /LENGTH=329 /DNA_ID=CAMNT_0007593033 /DNA_START=217 /DNA_END=1203 /DNA_ORIENTATION=+